MKEQRLWQHECANANIQRNFTHLTLQQYLENILVSLKKIFNIAWTQIFTTLQQQIENPGFPIFRCLLLLLIRAQRFEIDWT